MCNGEFDAAKRVGFPEAALSWKRSRDRSDSITKSKSAEHAIDAAMSTHAPYALYSVPDYLRFTPVNMDDDEKYDCRT